MGRVEDKIVIITGAASGLGKAGAELLGAEGARVVCTDIDEEAGRAVAASLPQGIFVPQDVGAERDWKTVMGECDAAFGAPNVVINNAGITIYADIESLDLDQWEYQQRVNSTGTFLGCKYAIAAMKTAGGSIINVSSIAAQVGVPQYVGYSASKGAVRSLTKSVALHCQQKGYKIRCNSIHPGVINTPMGQQAMLDAGVELKALNNPDLPMGEAMDIAYMMLYLASSESKYVNGAEMVVDNAYTAA